VPCPAQQRCRPRRLHCRSEPPGERLAARIFKHQHGPAALAHQLKRSHRPCAIELILQFIFMDEAFEASKCRVLEGRKHDQYRVPLAVGAPAPFPVEHAITILPKNVQTAISTNAEERGCADLRTSSPRLSHLALPLVSELRPVTWAKASTYDEPQPLPHLLTTSRLCVPADQPTGHHPPFGHGPPAADEGPPSAARAPGGSWTRRSSGREERRSLLVAGRKSLPACREATSRD
jgi:hypothetical protein